MLDVPNGKSAPMSLGLRFCRDGNLQKGSGELCAVLFDVFLEVCSLGRWIECRVM
jgi:hypothetical protein